MSTLDVNNPPKFYIVLLALICISILMITSTIESEAGLGLLGLIVGYGIGNGVASKQGEPIEPVFGHRDPER